MANETPDPEQCKAFQGDLAELALGILTGRERAVTLRHIESCTRCSTELDSLLVVADSLSLLVPECEPPLGFDVRLAEHFKTNTARRFRRPGRREALFAGAALLSVVLGFALGSVLLHGGGSSTFLRAHVTAARLGLHGVEVGQVLLSTGKQSWLFLSLDDGNRTGEVTCQVTLADGKSEDIGGFALHPGYRAWGTDLPKTAATVRAVQITTASGTVLASADIHP